MGRRIAGVLRELDKEDAARIGAIEGPIVRPSTLTDAAPFCDLLIYGDEQTRRVSILRAESGELYAASGSGAARLRPGKLASFLFETEPYRADFDIPEGLSPGKDAPFAQPYLTGPVKVDAPALATRFFRTLGPPPPSKRLLRNEQFHARLPASYDPRTPAPLLIWINAGDSGRPPATFSAALDELGAICAGADNCGNERQPAERLQIALDLIATVRERCLIDPDRVYATGISGGGKIATILWAGCPEFIRGCIPIVGTGWCADIPIGGGKVWPKQFGPPTPGAMKLLLTQRLAPITGPADFNYEPIKAYMERAAQDGISVRIFDVPGMGHELPSPDEFAAALRWVDEPARAVRRKGEAAASDMLTTYLHTHGDGAPATPEARAALARITEIGPWTDAAWRAIDLLQAPARPTH